MFPVCLPQQVKLIVQNALRLYSQDRTGLVDYALESGGKEDVLRLVCRFVSLLAFYPAAVRKLAAIAIESRSSASIVSLSRYAVC